MKEKISKQLLKFWRDFSNQFVDQACPADITCHCFRAKSP
jgi:hypothetical protein